MSNFNDWLATKAGNALSSMWFFYFCVLLDLVELKPIIVANNTIDWCTYLSTTVIQLVALPVLGYMQKISTDHHEQHADKLDRIIEKL